jgi:hypothetical protein
LVFFFQSGTGKSEEFYGLHLVFDLESELLMLCYVEVGRKSGAGTGLLFNNMTD